MNLSRGTTAFLALLCLAVLFVAINVIADETLQGARIDLTAQHLYTLSPGTRATLAKIQEPVTLRFYYSPQLGDTIPSYGVYAQRVREMLQQYAALAPGKIDLQILDPEPFSPTEDRADAFGLQGVPLDQSGEQVYFGLAATNSTDDQQVIPFFQPDRERFLEYDLTKVVHGLAFPKKTVVGLVTALPLEGDFMAAMQGQPLVPYAVIDQLRQLYDVRTLSTEFDKVDSDVDVLMIAQPQNLPDKTQYAIDQFVLRGGKALVFVDPYSETQAAHPSRFNPPGSPADSNLPRLMKAWGVEMEAGKVAADLKAARRVNAGTASRVVPMEYIAWLSLKGDDLNHDQLITGDLDAVNMATAGILKPVPGAKTKMTPLLETSTQSMEIPAEKVQGMPDVAALRAAFKPSNERLVLAAEITGPADTAFPDGPPKPPAEAKKDEPAKEGTKAADPPANDASKGNAKDEAKDAGKDAAKDQGPPQLKTSVQPINVVIVADTDILDDRFWVQVQDFFGQRVVVPTASNGDFVANAIEVLAGGNDLISLRSRGTSARPFTVVDDIQRAAESRYRDTEKALQDKLKETEGKIKDLQGKESGGGTVQLSAEQSQAIENFRGEMIRTRQRLRDVQRALRQDIDGLKATFEFIDIALIPILVAIAALILGLARMKRRQRRAAHT